MVGKSSYLFSFVLLAGLVAGSALATDYYVAQNDPAANDANPGTEALPWETLRKATQTAVAGDTVYVKAGTYIDTIEPNFEDKFQVVNNGTAADPITFISSPRHAAVVRSESLPDSRSDYAWGIGEGAQYIIIDGFKIEGGIVIGYDGASHCTVRNCEVIYGRCPDSDPSLNWGLTVYGADYCTIENNYVHNMTFSGSTSHNAACIMVFIDSDYNIIQSNTADAGSGIVYSSFGQKGGQMDDNIWRYNIALNATTGFLGMASTNEVYPTQDNTYYQNIIIDCVSAFNLSHMAYRFVMYNNTAVDCDIFFGASKITNIDTQLWNNILVGTDGIAIRWSGYPTAEPFTTLIDYSNYNCFYNCSKIAYREKLPSLSYYTLAEWQSAWGFDMASIVADPCLVSGGDYHLQAGSPCINAGVDLQDYDSDLNTTESINMGAYITGTEVIGCDWEPAPSPPGAASGPDPDDSDTGISAYVVLSWAAGSGATSYDVYFGISLNEVTNAMRSAGDVTGNGLVDWDDIQILSQQWLTDAAGANPSADLNGNNNVNFVDLAIIAADWRQEADAAFKGNKTATTFDPGTLAGYTTYYWRIDNVNSAGTTTGTIWSFTTGTAALPGTASNPSPTDSDTDVSITGTVLSWTAGSDVASHDVYFGTTSPGTSRGNQTATTFDPGTMAYSTTYYWRIDEVNVNGTATGTVWNFTTEAEAVPPGAASNPTPADSTTDVGVTSDLSWTAGSGATSHNVYFGTSSPGTFQDNQAGAVFDTGVMSYNTTYYWRIDEINSFATTTGAVWSFTTGPDTGIDPSLLGWWEFENDANDSAGGNDGAVYGAVYTSGKIGQAISFDEIDDYVLVPDFDYTNGFDEFSLSFWFKISDVAGSTYQYIFSHGTVTTANSLNVYFSETDEGAGGEELRTWIALGDSTNWYSVSQPDYADGAWHLYTITVSSVDGTTIYVDESSILTNPAIKGASLDPTTDIFLGGRCDLNSERFYGNPAIDDGLIDDVRLYNRVLSPSEVTTLAAGGGL